MSDDAPIPAPASAAGPDGLEERIRALANEIVDPCSAAQALPVGLVDMGLLLRVQLEPAGGEGEVHRSSAGVSSHQGPAAGRRVLEPQCTSPHSSW